MKRLCRVLLLVLAVVCPGLANGSVILDNYSTSASSSSYVPYLWNGTPAMAFNVANGVLAPTGRGDWIGSGFYWNGGETLKPGEGVSAVIQVSDYYLTSGALSYAGLCVSTSTSAQSPYRFMANYTGTEWCMDEEQSSTHQVLVDGSGMTTWDKRSLLTLTRGTGEANQAVITWAFSKIDGYGLVGTGTVTISGLAASTPLYFGTAAISPYASPQPTWDNLTYIPEPASLALLALGGLVVLRRQRR